MNIGEDFGMDDINLEGEKSLADEWILTRLNETIGNVTQLSERYEFGETGRLLYNFIWDDFCDWYIEMAKVPMTEGTDAEKAMTRSVLLHTLDNILKMLHPFMPFVTEEIYQTKCGRFPDFQIEIKISESIDVRGKRKKRNRSVTEIITMMMLGTACWISPRTRAASSSRVSRSSSASRMIVEI